MTSEDPRARKALLLRYMVLEAFLTAIPETGSASLGNFYAQSMSFMDLETFTHLIDELRMDGAVKSTKEEISRGIRYNESLVRIQGIIADLTPLVMGA